MGKGVDPMRALLMRMFGIEQYLNRVEARVAAYEARLTAMEQALRNLRGS
jgi:hypothetical protein